jgi:hypothetical protein
MENQDQGNKPLMDRIWNEMTSVSGPKYKAHMMTGKPDVTAGFLGRVSSVSFRRQHPFEQHAHTNETNLTMDDWTRQHD